MTDVALRDVFVPGVLMAAVDRIAHQKVLGFCTRSEFIVDAIRMRIEQLAKLGLTSIRQ